MWTLQKQRAERDRLRREKEAKGKLPQQVLFKPDQQIPHVVKIKPDKNGAKKAPAESQPEASKEPKETLASQLMQLPAGEECFARDPVQTREFLDSQAQWSDDKPTANFHPSQFCQVYGKWTSDVTRTDAEMAGNDQAGPEDDQDDKNDQLDEGEAKE